MFCIVLDCVHNLEPRKQEGNMYVRACACGAEEKRKKNYSNIYCT